MKLTPRQALILVNNAQDERIENFKILASMLGAGKDDSQELQQDDEGSLEGYDTAKIDAMAKRSLDELRKKATIRV